MSGLLWSYAGDETVVDVVNAFESAAVAGDMYPVSADTKKVTTRNRSNTFGVVREICCYKSRFLSKIFREVQEFAKFARFLRSWVRGLKKMQLLQKACLCMNEWNEYVHLYSAN